ncbi:bicaudal D-related protein homolog [Anabrus simplex]|uniref:bicaudal D-related protein homolog n=1 Tax=Anabrus simplex TaxID=316456 RepID=UPI0035A38DAB
MMHREKMKPKYALEDYIYEMESRSMQPSADPEDLDIYAQLQQKEKDLILAAELGKALLEKNEELSRQNERIAEDFSQKLELLEQDRHALRRRLASLQSESDARLLELQADISALTTKLTEREATLRHAEREKAVLVAELTEQNQRLAMQLKESNKAEEQLSAQLQGLRDQCNLRKSSLQDHVTSLEMLRDEIQMLTDKKMELERRLQALLDERERLTAALDEATDRIVLLEHQSREHELQFRHSQRELEQLRSVNSSLGERLEAMSGSTSSSSHSTHRSLLNEMECDGDIEEEEEELPLLAQQQSTDTDTLLRQEVLTACQQLRGICGQLRRSRSDSFSSSGPESTPDSSNCDVVKVGDLSELVKELTALVRTVCSHSRTCSSSSSGLDLELELEAELHRAREALEKAQRALDEKQEQLKRASDQIRDLTSKLSIREAELKGVVEERDRARGDLEDTHLARDELIRKAWNARDGAVARKNHVEVELARTRIDVMQANSQLLEAIQQKVELSQQLEQWQMDMHALLDDKVRKKLTSQERKTPPSGTSSGYESNSSTGSGKKSSSRRLFGLFQL